MADRKRGLTGTPASQAPTTQSVLASGALNRPNQSQYLCPAISSDCGIFHVRPRTPTERENMATIGYARVSTPDQSLDRQLDELRAEGCERIFAEAASGKRGAHRPQWEACLAHLRAGDTLIVVELSLGFSAPDCCCQWLNCRGLRALRRHHWSRAVPWTCSDSYSAGCARAGRPLLGPSCLHRP